MEKFNSFITEKFEEPVKPKDLHLVVLGWGDEEGTFADIVYETAKKKGIRYDLVKVDEAFISASDLEIGEVTFSNFDGKDNDLKIKVLNSIVFVRAGAIQSLVSQALVSTLQTFGFFLINDLQSMSLCDNKMANAISLERNNIPIPKTAVINNVKSIEYAHESIGGKFPVIIKTLTGTQGVGVSKVNDMASLVSVCQSMWKFDAQLLIQEFIKTKSDIRTLVVDGHIIGAAERVRQDSDEFRNNVHLGAKTVPYKLSEEEKDVIVRAARASGALYCGVDHCKEGNKIYVLEVNGSPGIRSHFLGYDIETGEEVGKKTDMEMFNLVLEYFSTELHRRPLMRQESGYIESLVLEGMEDNPIRAKFDTGNSAKATMLHVDKLEVDGDTAIWQKNGYKFESEIVDVSEARRLDHLDKRPVIEHGVTFNNKKYYIRLGLTTKDSASEMLVNRDLLNTFRVSVHPNRKFILSDIVLRNDDTDH